MWGLVVSATDGYRAQYAQPIVLFLRDRGKNNSEANSRLDMAASLARYYECIVGLVPSAIWQKETLTELIQDLQTPDDWAEAYEDTFVRERFQMVDGRRKPDPLDVELRELVTRREV